MAVAVHALCLLYISQPSGRAARASPRPSPSPTENISTTRRKCAAGESDTGDARTRTHRRHCPENGPPGRRPRDRRARAHTSSARRAGVSSRATPSICRSRAGFEHPCPALPCPRGGRPFVGQWMTNEPIEWKFGARTSHAQCHVCCSLNC